MQTKSIKPYKVGEVVFGCEPIVHCIETEFKGKHCDNCLKKCDSLKKCSKCCLMSYCDKVCQQNDWSQHKYECKVFRHQNYKTGSLVERLLLRLWLCVKSDPTFVIKSFKTFDGSDICLNDVKPDGKNIVRDQMLYDFFVQMCVNFDNFGLFYDRKQLLSWFGLTAPGPGGSTFDLKYYAESPSKLKYSDESIDKFSAIIGTGLYIQMLSITHSCLPNTIITTNGSKLQYRAIKPIGWGKPLTASFVDLGANRDFRKQMLGMSSTVCDCDKCGLNLDKDIDYAEYDDLLANNRYNWSFIGNQAKAQIENKDYVIDENLFMYMRAIFGEYHDQISEALIFSFVCFALYSKKSSKSLIRLWYKRIEPSVRVTHGSDHPLHKLFTSVYRKSIEISMIKRK